MDREAMIATFVLHGWRPVHSNRTPMSMRREDVRLVNLAGTRNILRRYASGITGVIVTEMWGWRPADNSWPDATWDMLSDALLASMLETLRRDIRMSA